MSYRVEISPEAQEEIKSLSGYVRSAALEMLRALRNEPRPPRAKELHDKPNVYRIWLMKKWRIVYRIEEDSKHVFVLRVRLKKQIDYESV
jgi:mRNA-degrading endonuclease RelE of RelBE toxin-antitoxin system